MKSILLIDIYGYLAREGQPIDNLLLYPQFGIHVQKDNIHSIVHIHNTSITPHNCNRIGHHSGSYYYLLLESKIVKIK